MNQCPSLAQFERLLNEELIATDRAALEAHIDACPSCQQTRDRLLRDDDVMQDGRCVSPGPAPAIAFLEELAQTPPAKQTTEVDSENGDTCTPIRFPGAATARGPLGQLGPYHMIKELGRGAFGVVFQAYDQERRCLVAIKVLKPEKAARADECARFKREAHTAAIVVHEHVVAHQLGTASDFPLPYIVMEYVDGESVSERLERLDVIRTTEAVRIVCQVAIGLAAAHERKLIHRDIKPSNIMLEKGSGRAKLTDFGLARKIETTDTRLTKSGAIMGTPAYMSPEQVSAPESVDSRTGVYSLGAVLYELLTREPPFRGASVYDVLRQVVQDEPRLPRKLNEAIPADLETIVMKCLAKEPARRYQSAAALADDLRRFHQGQAIVARPVGALTRTWRSCRRNPLVTVLTVAVGLLLVTGTGVATYFAVTAQRNAQLAQELRYQTDMYLVENLLREEADLPRVEKLLDEYQPQPGQRDLRDTRWYRFAWLYRHSTPKTLSAHEDAVYGVAFAPDGKRFATASSDFHHWGEVKIWDTVTRQLLATLPSHTVKSVAFGRDGQTLVTTTRDGTIEFRDADTARLLHIFQHPSVPARTAATAVVSSRDGMMLGAAWEDGTVIVWDVPSRAPLDQFQHSSAVQSMAFAPDGRTVATGSEDGQLHVRVLASKTSLALHRHGRQSAHVGSVLSVAYSLDSTTLASGGKDCKVIVWNMGNVAELPPPEEQMLPTDQTVLGHDEPGHGQPVTGVVFAPKRECNLLATVSFDGTVQLWNLNLARPQSTLKGHMGKLYCVALSPDSKTLLVGSERGTVRLWDLSKRDELTALWRGPPD